MPSLKICERECLTDLEHVGDAVVFVEFDALVEGGGGGWGGAGHGRVHADVSLAVRKRPEDDPFLDGLRDPVGVPLFHRDEGDVPSHLLGADVQEGVGGTGHGLADFVPPRVGGSGCTPPMSVHFHNNVTLFLRSLSFVKKCTLVWCCHVELGTLTDECFLANSSMCFPSVSPGELFRHTHNMHSKRATWGNEQHGQKMSFCCFLTSTLYYSLLHEKFRLLSHPTHCSQCDRFWIDPSFS